MSSPSHVHDEVDYLEIVTKLLSTCFTNDHFGNGAILRTHKNPALLSCLKSPNLSNNKSQSPPAPSQNPMTDVRDFLHEVISRNTKNDMPNLSSFSSDFAVSSISGHSFAMKPHSTVLNAIGINLYHNQSSEVISFVPTSSYYSSMPFTCNKTFTLSQQLDHLKLAILQIHATTSRKQQHANELYLSTKPQYKKQAEQLNAKISSLKKELDAITSLKASYNCQKNLDRVELLYDEARLNTIPPSCSVKLVGSGFKVGVSSIWLERLNCPFAFNMKNSPCSSVTVTIGDVSDSSSGMGVISFRAEGLYLSADSFPTVKFEAFSARCEFTCTVPVVYTPSFRRWTTTKELKLNLKKIESKIKSSKGSIQPPQTLIRYATEMILKMLIIKNLRKFIPFELGCYLEKVRDDHLCSASGTLNISGPHLTDLEAELDSTSNASEQGRDFLNLTLEQTQQLLMFAKVVCEVDVSTCAKFVNYVKGFVLFDKSGDGDGDGGGDLVELWQKSYNLFLEIQASSSATINMHELFNVNAKKMSESPIEINLEISHLDAGVEVQGMLKSCSDILMRLVYENLGGTGDVTDVHSDSDSERSVNGEEKEKEEEVDDLANGVREAINSVFVPLRRAFVVIANNLQRITCDVNANVKGPSKRQGLALLTLLVQNLQILATPSFPVSFVDFAMCKYETKCRMKKVKGRDRFVFELTKPEDMSGEDDDDDNEDDGDNHESKHEGKENEDEGTTATAPIKSSQFGDFKVNGYIDNMLSVLVFDPEILKDLSSRGVVDLSRMNAGDAHENSPFNLHFSSEKMHMKAPLMILIEEGLSCVDDFLKFGGSGSGSSSSNSDLMADLSVKLSRVIAVLLRAIHKHSSKETFSLQLATAMRMSSKNDALLVEVEGNASIDEVPPIKIRWETSFVDIVYDLKEVLNQFRDGGEDVDGGGGDVLSGTSSWDSSSSGGSGGGDERVRGKKRHVLTKMFKNLSSLGSSSSS